MLGIILIALLEFQLTELIDKIGEVLSCPKSQPLSCFIFDPPGETLARDVKTWENSGVKDESSDMFSQMFAIGDERHAIKTFEIESQGEFSKYSGVDCCSPFWRGGPQFLEVWTWKRYTDET